MGCGLEGARLGVMSPQDDGTWSGLAGDKEEGVLGRIPRFLWLAVRGRAKPFAENLGRDLGCGVRS